MRAYSDQRNVPLGGYAALLGAFGTIFGGLLVLGVRRKRLPAAVGARDVLLLGVATHKLSRILTRDWVTAPLRAPFTHYDAKAAGGEVDESARGDGLRRAIGTLATCPYCTGPWVAGALTALLVAKPRAARVVASVLSMVTVSDALHRLYGRMLKA